MLKIEDRPIEIVLDCDDILWPMVERLTKRLGIELEYWTNFYLSDNLHLSPEVSAKAKELLAGAELFRDIKFDKGIKDILRPQELGAKVIINSHSTSREALELKKEQLFAAVPKLKPEQLDFMLIEVNTFSKKKLNPQTFILSDDNPLQIANSTAALNVMRKWPWNKSNSAKAILQGKRRVVSLPNLEAINRYVYYRTKALLRSGV